MSTPHWSMAGKEDFEQKFVDETIDILREAIKKQVNKAKDCGDFDCRNQATACVLLGLNHLIGEGVASIVENTIKTGDYDPSGLWDEIHATIQNYINRGVAPLHERN